MGETPVYLFGQGDWLMAVRSGRSFEDEADWYAPFGANLIRVTAINTILPDEVVPHNPWLRLPDGRFDLTRYDGEYWARLRDFVQRNEERGRFVLLQIFDEVGLESGPNRWSNHPFHPARNINGLGLPSTNAVPEFYDLSRTAVLEVQERYFDRLLFETAGFGNVLYEICNEYTGPTSWLDRWLDRFTAAERITGRNFVVTNMSCGGALLNHELAHPAIDVLDLWHAPTSLRFASLPEIRDRFLQYVGTKPLLCGRIGPEPDLTDSSSADRDRARTIFWTIFFSGGVGATTKEDGDFQRVVFGPPLYADDTVWEEHLGAFHSILESAGFPLGLAPAPEIIVSAPASFALGLLAPSRVAMVYLESSGGSPGGGLVLEGLPHGDLEVGIYDPATGHLLESRRRAVRDGTLDLPVPAFARDLVVLLRTSPLSVHMHLPGFQRRAPFTVEIVVRGTRDLHLPTDEAFLRGGLTLNGIPVDRIGRFHRSERVRSGRSEVTFRAEGMSAPPGYYALRARLEYGDQVRTSVARIRISP